MKKKTKIILTSVTAASVTSGLLAGLYATYRVAFHSPNGNQNDDFEYRFTDQTRPLSYKIFGMISAIVAGLTFLLVGLFLWPIVFLLGAVWFCCSIIACFKVINEKEYHYPLLGRF